jgi:hypothetical protein
VEESPTSPICAYPLSSYGIETDERPHRLNSFLSPTEDASNSINRVADHMQLDQTHNLDTSAFYGFPIGVETDEW